MRLKSFLRLLLLPLAALAVSMPAQAGMVGTAAMSAQAAVVDAAGVKQQRDWIAGQLVQSGVDETDALARVASMTDAQVAQLHQRIDSAPAGGSDALLVAVVVFLVLELTGYIDVIPER